MLMDEVRGEIVLRRLPRDVREALTPDQVSAIRRASSSTRPRRHPIDLRLNLRLPVLGRCYLVLLVGKELRSPERRAADRELKPLDYISQGLVMLFGTTIIILAALLGMLFENSIAGN